MMAPMRGWFQMLAVALMLCGCANGPQSAQRAPARQERAERGMPSITLPTTAGAWTRPDAPKRIDERSIFSYMDGGGELYLGYRFDHLDVYEYAAAGRDPILVELYWMRGSDDAFGLLSNDWGGEGVALQRSDAADSSRVVPASRALYGAGLLRIWSDALYARVLAARDTADSREQVMALGRAIVAGRPLAPRPALLDLLPDRVGAAYSIRRDRVWYLRSHLVLNSAYFLASDNILDLSLACEAAIAPYETDPPPAGARRKPASRPQLLVVRYPDAVTARRALGHFLAAYLPEAGTAAPPADRGARQVERGWVGYRLEEAVLLVAFDAPDARTARGLVEGR